MKSELSVYGVQIETDKTVKGIKDSRVSFVDGSWCDVRTGMIICKGGGYINFLTKLSDLPGVFNIERKIFDSWRHRFPPIEKVNIAGIYADLEVHVSQSDQVAVSVLGSGFDYQDIGLEQGEKTLFVTDSGGKTMHIESMAVSGRGAVGIQLDDACSVSKDEGSVDSEQRNPLSRHITVKVYVPMSTALEICDVRGKVTIADINGSLLFNADTYQAVCIGRIRDLTMKIDGVGPCVVESVEGSCDITTLGAGSVEVRHGDVKNLKLETASVGSITYLGFAVDATLTIKSVGNIYVNEVQNKPKYTVSGLGKIHVVNW